MKYIIFLIHIVIYVHAMYIFYIQSCFWPLRAIYSKVDLGHYWANQASLYCGLLLILLESYFEELQRMLLAEPGHAT